MREHVLESTLTTDFLGVVDELLLDAVGRGQIVDEQQNVGIQQRRHPRQDPRGGAPGKGNLEFQFADLAIAVHLAHRIEQSRLDQVLAIDQAERDRTGTGVDDALGSVDHQGARTQDGQDRGCAVGDRRFGQGGRDPALRALGDTDRQRGHGPDEDTG